jgi:hypothetical protein
MISKLITIENNADNSVKKKILIFSFNLNEWHELQILTLI